MNRDGLTLIEVIVAALILALTVGGVLYIFSTEKGVVARTGRQMQAMDFGRQQLEELKDEVRADRWPGSPGVDLLADTAGAWIPGTTPLTGDFGPGGKFEGAQGRQYRVTNIDADSAGDPVDYKRVDVEVNWSEPAETQ